MTPNRVSCMRLGEVGIIASKSELVKQIFLPTEAEAASLIPDQSVKLMSGRKQKQKNRLRYKSHIKLLGLIFLAGIIRAR